jgi:elongation factor Ts
MTVAKISASLVKELRERTSAGMMECKKALEEAGGDLAAAELWLAKYGARKVQKVAMRVAAEGLIAQALSENESAGVLIEVNCETDFVVRDESFIAFVQQTVQTALVALEEKGILPDSFASLSFSPTHSVEEALHALIARLGENIQIRRFHFLKAGVGEKIVAYIHGGRIGVLAALRTSDAGVAKDIAMHIAAADPAVISPDQVSQDALDKERDIMMTQAKEQGKPLDIAEKMVAGRLSKYRNECSLLGQPFIKQPEKTVGAFLKESTSEVISFVRYAVGEGIEKKQGNFAEEVMHQVRGNA